MHEHAQDQGRREDQAKALLGLAAWGDAEVDQAIGLHDLLESPDAGPTAITASLRRRAIPELRDRYRRQGNPLDLVRAETFAAGVLDQAAGLARALHMLSYLGQTRFYDYQSGALTALDDAIDAYQRLDHAVQAGGSRAAAIMGDLFYGALNGLAAALSARYSARRELLFLDLADAEKDAIRDDLQRAIQVSRRVMESASPSHVLGGQVALATCLTMAAEDDPGVLDEAVGLLEDALGRIGTSPAPGKREMRLGIQDRLAVALQRRGRLPDIDRAITLLADCCAQAGPGLMYVAGGRLSLATARLRRWQHTRSERDEQAVRSAYRDAWAAGLRHHLPAAFDAATQQGAWAWDRSRWAEAGDAYGRAVRTLHVAVRGLAGWADKQLPILKAPGVAARAAFALARSGADEDALVALETGRGVLLAEMLDRRSIDYERIAQTAGPDAARQYRDLTAQLTELEALNLAGGSPAGAAEFKGRLEALRRDRDLFIRRHAGDYPGAGVAPAAPPSASELRSAAGSVPVVHLAATDQGGLAVLVPPGREAAVRAIELPELTTEMAAMTAAAFREAIRTSSRVRCDEVCTALWYLAMGDLVPYLDGAERAILVPGGVLTALPWHAAKIPGRGPRHLLDLVAISYAPNIRALPAARAAAAGRDGVVSMLAIGQPEPTSAQPLHTEGEIAAIRAQQSQAFRVTELPAREASRAAVLGVLSDYQAIHFAGHATAQPDAPLASALLMSHDEPLTVRDLMTRGVGATRFAVLSACETARAGEELTDEIVSLPTALLQCGLSSVVASLWDVFDKPAGMIMSAFYENWQQEGLAPALALRAAQLWARDRGYPSPLAWASFIHEGP